MKLHFVFAWLLFCIFSIPAAAQPGGDPGGLKPPPKARTVYCNAPGSPLATAVHRADPGDTIHVYGLCEERVVVEQGPLTIRGVWGATLDGASLESSGESFDALITVRGAAGVSLQNLTIQNHAVGVLAEGGASVALSTVRLRNNERNLVLASADATLDDVFIEDGATGLQAQTGSRVTLIGDVEIQGTGLEGFSLLGSVGELRGGSLTIHDNAGLSLTVVGGSKLLLLGLPASASSEVAVFGNQGPGILLANGTLEIGGDEPVSPRIESSGNQGPGIYLTGGGRLVSAVGWARVVTRDNPVGLVAEAGSTIWMRGGLEVVENFGPGMVLSDTSLVLSPGINPVEIQNNGGPDVVLEFGTRSDLGAGVMVGSALVCDPTVLSRGAVICP